MNKTLITTAIAGVLGTLSFSASALTTGDTLNITAGGSEVTGCLVGAFVDGMCTLGSVVNVTGQTGSFFDMSGVVTNVEGFNGIVTGTSQAATGSHAGAPDGSESPDIDNPWLFFDNTGMHGTQANTDVLSQTGIDFSGWYVTWAGIPVIDMGGGLQDCGTTSDGICVDNFGNDIGGTYDNGTGIGNIVVTGDSYVLDYTAIVPQADASGFGGVGYALHLEGTVSAIPVPAAVWLFGSGLLGLVGVARRKKAA